MLEHALLIKLRDQYLTHNIEEISNVEDSQRISVTLSIDDKICKFGYYPDNVKSIYEMHGYKDVVYDMYVAAIAEHLRK